MLVVPEQLQKFTIDIIVSENWKLMSKIGLLREYSAFNIFLSEQSRSRPRAVSDGGFICEQYIMT